MNSDNSNKKIPLLFEKLIEHNNPQVNVEERKNQLRYFGQICEYQLGKENVNVVDQIQLKINQSKRYNSSQVKQVSHKFIELHQRLQNLKVLKDPDSILFALSKVSDEPQTIVQPLLWQNNSNTSQSSISQRSSRQNQLIQSQKELPSQQASQRSASPFIKQGPMPSGQEVDQRDIIRDLLYVFQGVEHGNFIKFSIKNDCYMLDSSIIVPESHQKMISQLAELGWLHRKVAQHIHYMTTEQHHWQITRAFSYALQQELVQYYQFLTILEKQADLTYMKLHA